MSDSCNSMDRSPPGSPVHGISQARILEPIATSFSKGIFPTQGSNRTHISCMQTDSLPLSHQASIIYANLLKWQSLPMKFKKLFFNYFTFVWNRNQHKSNNIFSQPHQISTRKKFLLFAYIIWFFIQKNNLRGCKSSVLTAIQLFNEHLLY